MPFLKLHGIAFASLLVLHSSVVFAEKNHGIGIDTGVSNYTNRDDLASPLSYGGPEQTIGAFYDYRGAKNRHWVRVAYMTGKLKPLSSASSADHYYGLIQYGYARPLSGDSRAVVTFWFGGIWDNMVSARDYSFGAGHCVEHQSAQRPRRSTWSFCVSCCALKIAGLSSLCQPRFWAICCETDMR